MGFRFQRRVTLFPGVRLNFSARGISATVGVPGASVNFGSRGPALNLGIPGTGLSFRQHLGNGHRQEKPEAVPAVPSAEVPRADAEVIQSAPVAEVTSDGLQTLKELVLRVREERESLRRAIPGARADLEKAQRRLRRARNWFFGLFLREKVPEREAAVEEKASALHQLDARLDGAFIDAEIALDDATLSVFAKLAEAFSDLARCDCVWDVTRTEGNDRRRTRSAASTSVERQPVQFAVVDEDEVLRTGANVLRLHNANGADLDIYPGFVLLGRSRADVALVDLRDVTLELAESRFVEDGRVPMDATVLGAVWAKTNKDGSPDRRFRDNYQIPLVRYGQLLLRSSRGLNEAYMFSSYDKAERFARAFARYQGALRAFGEKSLGAPDAAARQSPPLSTEPPAQTVAARPYTTNAIEFIKARRAISIDDAVRTIEEFAHLLKSDLESMSGQKRPVADYLQFVREFGGVAPMLRAFFGRSPSASALEPVAVRETNKVILQVLRQIEAALAGRTEEDIRGLLSVIGETSAAIAE